MLYNGHRVAASPSLLTFILSQWQSWHLFLGFRKTCKEDVLSYHLCDMSAHCPKSDWESFANIYWFLITIFIPVLLLLGFIQQWIHSDILTSLLSIYGIIISPLLFLSFLKFLGFWRKTLYVYIQDTQILAYNFHEG